MLHLFIIMCVCLFGIFRRVFCANLLHRPATAANPPDRPPATVPAPDPKSGFRTRFMLAPPHASSLEEVLVALPVPKALAGTLDKAWTLLT